MYVMAGCVNDRMNIISYILKDNSDLLRLKSNFKLQPFVYCCIHSSGCIRFSRAWCSFLSISDTLSFTQIIY